MLYTHENKEEGEERGEEGKRETLLSSSCKVSHLLWCFLSSHALDVNDYLWKTHVSLKLLQSIVPKEDKEI